MLVERTAQIVIEWDDDLAKTLKVFTEVMNECSPVCFNNGNPLSALTLHKRVYHRVKGRLNAQMTCTAIRLTAGAYVAAKHNGHDITKPFRFKKPYALFLVGKRGRDADFRKDGKLSIWTVGGRKKLGYTIPDYFKQYFERAVMIDSIIVKIRKGKLIGYVSLKIEVKEAKPIHPVGVDLNETNALVAVNPDNEVLFITGLRRRILNKRTFKTIKRLQRKLALKKAEGKNTRSVVRTLKRLQGKLARRTKDFCHTATKRLVEWCPENCVIVFEKLNFGQGKKGNKAWNRRFHQWPRGMIVRFVSYKVQGKGIVDFVDAKGTSITCSRCGLCGERSRHSFYCPNCDFSLHADTNAAFNIRNRYTVLRGGGVQSTTPEASSGGKPPVKTGGS